ncbi:hypothetical protein Adt_31613 [Abeliophyllum distichum]|uniref:Uncharacterized protein n=1 Tax=Abeliophyllum distichum TaxID=126358 RepID=A0ABD1REK7_9LAMI
MGEVLVRSVAPSEERAVRWLLVGKALARSVAPSNERGARWPSPSGRGTCAKYRSMGGASCKVAESQWERHLSEVLLHQRSKLQCGRVLVGEALVRNVAPSEERAAR